MPQRDDHKPSSTAPVVARRGRPPQEHIRAGQRFEQRSGRRGGVRATSVAVAPEHLDSATGARQCASPSTSGRYGTGLSYSRAFARLDQERGYQDWYKRHGYPPRAFGIGYGFDDDWNRTCQGDDFTRGSYYDRTCGSFGLHVRVGRRPSYYWSTCRYPDWNSYCRSYFVPVSYPYYCGTTSYAYGYPYYWGYSRPTFSSHSTYNYYYDDDGNAFETVDAATPYNYGSTSNVWLAQPVGAGAGSGPTAVPSSGQYTHRRLGVSAFYDGDFGLARREFVRALLALPDDPELLMLYAYAHFATGDYLVATLAIRRALHADPTLIDSPVDIARLYHNPRDLEAHMDALDAHLAVDSTDQDARFLAGFVRYAAGQTGEAATIFARCSRETQSDLLCLIMRDASLRADSLQRASERAVSDESAPASPTTSPARGEPDSNSS